MIKLFISQPMRGKTDEEILREREKAIERAKLILNDDEVEVLETFFTEFDNKKPLNYLAESLHQLANADAAYFIGEWDQFRGCKIENLCAKEYGISVIIED